MASAMVLYTRMTGMTKNILKNICNYALIIIIFAYYESPAGIEFNLVKINNNIFPDTLNGRINKEVYYRVVNYKAIYHAIASGFPEHRVTKDFPIL
jgi:hypothetical protein